MNIVSQEVEINRLSLADQVYFKVLQMIVSGRITSGTELSTISLADQLGVSRTPVGEALRRLAADGLIRQTNHHKATVTRFDTDDIVHIYDLRTVLEGAAAERAATDMDRATLARLRDEARKIALLTGNAFTAGALDFDVQLHDAIADACGNPNLRVEIAKYRKLVLAFCRISGSEINLRDAFAEHLEIIDALEAHNPSEARDLMVRHIRLRSQAVVNQVRVSEA